MIRAFFAITLQEDIKQSLLKVISQLKQNLPLSVKWAKEHQLHLTLRFIGNVTQEQIAQINAVISQNKFPAFNLEFQELVAFPEHRPRIIGMSVKLNNELAQIVQQLELQLNELSFQPEERPFLPHITLGRIAKPKRKSIKLLPRQWSISQAVSHITLYESQLSPDGSVYSVIKDFPLA